MLSSLTRSTVRRAGAAMTLRMPMAAPAAFLATTTGSCKWFDYKKGFGFITADDGQDVFVHQTAIHAEGFRSLLEGEPVEFELTTDPTNGKMRADKVTGPGGEYVKGAPPPRRDDYDY